MEKNTTKTPSNFRLNDSDIKKLEMIAEHYFGTAERNRTTTIKLLIEQEYKKIKELER